MPLNQVFTATGTARFCPDGNDNGVDLHIYCLHTVDSEIFARVYFRETSHMRSFVKIKSSRNCEINLSFTDKGKSYLCRDF